jgi:PAS domain S-box-containing protein
MQRTNAKHRPGLLEKPGVILSLVLGPADSISSTNRLFNAALLITSALCAGTGVANWQIGLSLDIVASAFLSAFFFAGIYVLSRFRGVYGPALWLASLCLPVFVGFVWIRNGGSAGATHAFLIILPFFFLLFATRRQRIILTTVYCLISTGLLTAEHFRPSLIAGYSSGNERYFDMLFSTMATQIGIAVAIGLFIREYRRLTRQLENLREKSEKRFGEVADTIPAMILELGAELSIEFANHATQVLTGLTEEELRTSQGLRSIIHPDDWPAVERELNAVLGGSAAPGGEWHLRLATGDVRDVLIRAVARHNADRVDGIRLYMVDITEKKQLEQQYLLAQKMESVGLMAGGIAHDFNNLLAGIMGYANLIKLDNTTPSGRPIDESLDGNVQPILTASQRAAELVQRLLVFSRRQPMRSTDFDVRDCLTEAGALLSHSMDKRIALKVSLHSEALSIHGDQSLLQSAVMNLCVNARDAMPGGGTLTIGCRHAPTAKGCDTPAPAAGYAEITVTDTGTGMSPEAQQHLFEPFFTTKPPGKGTGLGLASVHGAIKAHEGHIDVTTSTGRGTTFLLYIPLAPRDTSTARLASQEARAPDGKEHVVVVDDEGIVRSSLVKLLISQGHQATPFADPTEALTALQKTDHGFTFAIVDMIMPGMNGMELIKAFRVTNPSLPVLLISGYTGSGNTDFILIDPLVKKLAKPFDPTDLFAAMSKLASGGRRR